MGNKKKKSGGLARVAMVGVGRRGRVRLDLLKDCARTEVVAIVEPNKENEIWRSGETIPLYEDLQKVDQPYEAVWIATPTPTHAALVRMAAKQASFIFVEGPLDESEVVVDELYELCRQNGVELLVGWCRRFDPGYISLYEEVSGARITSAHIVHKEYPSPAIEDLKSTSMQWSVMSHVLNLVCLYMNEQMPLSVQATARDTVGAGVRETMNCTLEYPGGKVILVEVNMLGCKSFEDSIKLVVDGQPLVRGKQGICSSWAERFEEALLAEVEYFGRVCSLEKLLNQVKQSSGAGGHKVLLNPGHQMRLLQIGHGIFGKHIQEKVLSQMTHLCQTVAIVTADNSSEVDSLLERDDIDSVYICLPYQLHAEYVERCLQYNKKILCEKPLYDFPRVQKLAMEKDRLLMVGLQRRFDKQFQKARDMLCQLVDDEGMLNSLVIESREVRSPMEDTIEVLYSDCVHAFDTLSWLLEDVDCEISVSSIKIHGPGSSFTVDCPIWLHKYDKTVSATIEYSRGHPSYVQRVVVNGQTYGYNSQDLVWWNTWNEAFLRQFNFLATQPLMHPGAGQFCLTYSRSHKLLASAVEMVSDETDLEAVRQHAMRIGQLSTASMEEFLGVTGHCGMFSKGDRVYKPLMYEDNEWKIYQMIAEDSPELVKFVPKVYGRVRLGGVSYLEMHDLTYGYEKPKVFNLKVGEPGDLQKMHIQPYSIRVSGYTSDDLPRRAQQSWNDMVSYFKDYLKDRDIGNSRYEVIPEFKERLLDMLTTFNMQSNFLFRGTSLLFVFDSIDTGPQKPTVHLIDMTRTKESKGEKDHCLCFGLENAIKMLDQIYQKFVSRHAVFLCRHGYRLDYEDLNWVPVAKYPHDPPLSIEGIQQAYDLAKRLKHENLSLIVSSPFRRAVQTAVVMAQKLGVKFVIEPAMGEFLSINNRKAVPDLDPCSMEEAELMDPKYEPFTSSLRLESWESMMERVHSSLSMLCSKYSRVAIVSHRSTFQALLSVVVGNKFKHPLQFASITSLLPSSNKVGWVIDRLNMYSHLSVICESPLYNPNYAKQAYKDMIFDTDGKLPDS